MGFIGVYKAIFDYAAQADNELTIAEGDTLFVLEKGDDDWWKAKKKAPDEDDEEPEGLVPSNYVEQAPVLSSAKALYDYDRQTDEELSLKEDASLDIYDTSDPDWTLVGLNGEFGFAPANYIEISAAAPATPARSRAPTASSANGSTIAAASAAAAASSPAAALAGIIQQKTGTSLANGTRATASPAFPPRPAQITPEASDEEQAPALPRRPPSQQYPSPPQLQPYSPPPEPSSRDAVTSQSRQRARSDDDMNMPSSPAGYHIYNVHEMVSHLGRNRKMPSVLGINLSKGIIMIAPERSRDGPQSEWTAEKLEHYSIEGKHVFLELVRPSKSVDFHAGSKETAHEIVAALGELAGASRAAGLREVAAASNPASNAQKQGRMLYDFMAQADDEITVATGDEVLILDDTKSEDWWQVRRLKNGKEGSVPSSYVEITGNLTVPITSAATSHQNGIYSVEQNRLDEQRKAMDALNTPAATDSLPSMKLPHRQSSLGSTQKDKEKKRSSRKKSESKGSSKSKPDPSKVRTWTDRSGSFKVDAEFLGLRDSKIHLHKLNGVKIAVSVNKMSVADLDYIEHATGVSLDEDKPLSDIKRRSLLKRNGQEAESSTRTAGLVASTDNTPKYDWFDFFLACGVNPQICERYASAFARDQMGEENLPDIDPSLLRTLGLKEGDILRVMKHIDGKFGRVRNPGESTEIVASGGLFSGPGGALRNNTRKGRPAPAVQTNDSVNGSSLATSTQHEPPADAQATALVSAPAKPARASTGGFDDDAWDVKPSRQPTAAAAAPSTPAAPAAPTGALAELSLLAAPLQPTVVAPPPLVSPAAVLTPPLQPTVASPPPQQQQQQQPQPTGASSAFFNQLTAAPTGAAQRQRPQPPSLASQNSLVPPPPTRPLSAPQQQSSFGPPPLQPQLTGYRPPQSQIAPPGQSMNEINQLRYQQAFTAQQQPMQYQPTGYGQLGLQQGLGGVGPQATGYNQFALQSQPTGFNNFPPQIQQQFINGQQQGSPFADPPRQFQPQPTGFQPQSFQPQQMQPQQTGINNFLPPALQPQRTGNFTGGPSPFGNANLGPTNGFGNQPPPPMPPMPQQQQQQPPMAQPLVPQKTGPAPPVKFGMQQAAPKLVPQPTGRANLMNATPQNPFGF